MHIQGVNMMDEIHAAMPWLPQELVRSTACELREPLESVVGAKMTVDISNESLDEFGIFVDAATDTDKMDVVVDWYQEHLPDFAEDPAFIRIYQKTKRGLAERAGADKVAKNLDEEAFFKTMLEFGAEHWMQTNCPDYRQIVVEETKAMLDAIKKLASMSGPQLITAALSRVEICTLLEMVGVWKPPFKDESADPCYGCNSESGHKCD
jgi:hypothetical protein